MGVYKDRVKNHFKFNLGEIRDLVIAMLVMSFIFGFDDGREIFILFLWVANLIKIFAIVLFSVLLHVSLQKLVALITGHRVEFRLWIYGALIGLLIAVVSNGRLYFLAAGGILIEHMALHRLGMFRYGINSVHSMIIAFTGPLSNIILALICKLLYLSTGIEVFSIIVTVNIWYAIFSILPIPPLDGSTVFFGGRSTYVLLFSFIIAASIMIAMSSTLVVMLFGSLFLAVLFWFVYYIAIERFML